MSNRVLERGRFVTGGVLEPRITQGVSLVICRNLFSEPMGLVDP